MATLASFGCVSHLGEEGLTPGSALGLIPLEDPIGSVNICGGLLIMFRALHSQEGGAQQIHL